MIVLREDTNAQTFKFIPRIYEADSMTFTHEETGEVLSYDIIPTVTTYYLSVTEIVDLKEGHFYKFTVYNGTDIVYKDKVFCTNQTIETFSVNNNEYTQHSSNNDFIIYE
jgi:hypothetical protein